MNLLLQFALKSSSFPMLFSDGSHGFDGSHASSSDDEFEKELDLLEQRKSPDQAISSTLYANAQIKQKVTSSIEKMERLGRLKADNVENY